MFVFKVWRVRQKCSTRVSRKSVPRVHFTRTQEGPLKSVSRKSIKQSCRRCPTRVSSKSVSLECPSRVSLKPCQTTVCFCVCAFGFLCSILFLLLLYPSCCAPVKPPKHERFRRPFTCKTMNCLSRLKCGSCSRKTACRRHCRRCRR